MSLPIPAGDGSTLAQSEKVALVCCIEEGLRHGKLKPYEAVNIGQKLGLAIPSWIEDQRQYYIENQGTRP